MYFYGINVFTSPSELQHDTDMKDLVFALLVYKFFFKKKRFLLAFTASQTSKLSASPFALDCHKGLFIYLFIYYYYYYKLLYYSRL